ncbi:MAG: hypothetical protein R3D98_15750 [Candidatus Krumholzibacteriia bacterium]
MTRSLLVALVLLAAVAAAAATGDHFGPILGTPSQFVVEVAVGKLVDSADYAEQLAEGRVFAAIASIMSVAEAEYVNRIHELRNGADGAATPAAIERLAEVQARLAELNAHAGRPWSFWRNVAGVADLVASGELTGYPTATLERQAFEMQRAFEPLLRPLETGSVFGGNPD